MQKLKHIAVAGNIGAGKNTLFEMVSKHYKWGVLYEDTNTNPYLSDFYN
ncbi:MAG TPA: deoxynucleoside kinase, partial [Saprospiraceae bacterium]|nr:deoxynucleoside kinase [Saprospiraceae bacterium]